MPSRRGPNHWILTPRGALLLVIGVALCCIPPVTVILAVIEMPLLRAGILNTRDLAPLVGSETGTVGDFVLNIWHWDAMIFLGMLASLPSLMVGVALVRHWWRVDGVRR